jgi:LmbE family N-acetylglucosaminyl deacetylase
MSKILVIAAHPDDEVLGCGGTIARLADEGHEVQILILGEGATSRDDGSATEVEQLRADARRAAQILGAVNVRFASLPDNRFDSVALLDVIKQIEAVIEEFQPEVVYTQHGGDLNVDHQITFRAVMTAVRPMQGSCVRALFAYEVASSTEWAFQKFEPVFRPSRFVDITATLEKKIEAMAAYEAESRPAPHPRAPEVLRAMAVVRGSAAGLKAAEAFEVIWQIR